MSTSAGWDRPRTSLYTDHYELTMLRGALQSGAAHRQRSSRPSPGGCPTGAATAIVAGTGRLLEGIANSASASRNWTSCAGPSVVNEQTLEWLAGYRFTGDIWGYPEGEAYFPTPPC